MPQPQWKPTEKDKEYEAHICPKCKGRTESLIAIEEDGFEFAQAERCPHCRWIVNFEADVIEVANY